MSDNAGRNGWQLVDAEESDLETLMTWFRGPEDVDLWGGPRFRFPFTMDTFREYCRWGKMASFRLNAPAGEFAAFGQVYERYGRINFARLVVNPGMRGTGVGKRLLAALMEAGPRVVAADEFSLFCYRHNAAALACYRSMGFTVRDYPQGAPMADVCYYLTRPL